MRWRALLAMTIAACCTSCYTTPQAPTAIREGAAGVRRIEFDRDAPYEFENAGDCRLPRSFEVLSWNGLAGCRSAIKNITGLRLNAFACSPERWDEVFCELSEEKDIILIQEAYLDDGFLRAIGAFGEPYSWNMAQSFMTGGGMPNGVATLSTASAQSIHPLLSDQPFLPTPKSALLTVYGFEDAAARLLVVNIHAVLMGSRNFGAQLRRIKERIDAHEGPVILAGDFNTLSKDRLRELEIFAQGPGGLEEVRFDAEGDRRVRMFRRPVDYVFYRGLRPDYAYAVDLGGKGGKVSDHNPIVVRFSLDEDR